MRTVVGALRPRPRPRAPIRPFCAHRRAGANRTAGAGRLEGLMGVTIHLQVDRRAIDPAAWAEVYDDTLRLLRAHPSGLLGLERREVLGRPVPVYTREIERADGDRRAWCVVGDRRSLRVAESFCLTRELEPPAPPGCGLAPGAGGVGLEDLVLQEPEERGGWSGFQEKTQGEPYHVPVLAAALVVEARFPGAALVWGDIEEDDALEARAWAERVLGREIAAPVLLDAPALLRRLSARWQGEALLKAYLRRFQGRAAAGLGRIFSAVDRGLAEAWLRAGLRAPDPADEEDVGWPGRIAFVQGWLTATQDLPRLCEIACRDPGGPAMPPADLAAAIAGTGALVSPELQRRIARAQAAPIGLRSDVLLAGALVAAMVFHGWETGGSVDPAALEGAFARAFPGEAEALCAAARASNARLEETAALLCEAVEASARLEIELGPHEDLGELAALGTAEAISPARRRQLIVLAHALRELWSAPRDEATAACLAGEDPEAARHLLAAAVTARGPTLTEDAWGWILREEDPAVLGVVVRLAWSEPQTVEGCALKRAVLESRVLCEAIGRMMADEAVMAEARALLEDERRREAERLAEEAAEGATPPA
jgi:hypothetical protein